LRRPAGASRQLARDLQDAGLVRLAAQTVHDFQGVREVRDSQARVVDERCAQYGLGASLLIEIGAGQQDGPGLVKQVDGLDLPLCSYQSLSEADEGDRSIMVLASPTEGHGCPPEVADRPDGAPVGQQFMAVGAQGSSQGAAVTVGRLRPGRPG
jgi:hypothetical protein